MKGLKGISSTYFGQNKIFGLGQGFEDPQGPFSVNVLSSLNHHYHQ
jgi:hypothetical protein